MGASPQGPPPYVDLIVNGGFSAGMTSWLPFATPDMGHIVTQVSNGMLEFYREPQHDGRANQAVVFQWTDTPLPLRAPVVAAFDLGNSSTARKRIAVLIHEDEFSDLYACTFWLEPGAPMRRYTMRSHTTKAWHNATIAFYAASAGSDGGFYQVDNVTLMYDPMGLDDAVLCEDPTTPAPPGGPYSPTLLQNGHFFAGLAPWAIFHQLTWQLTGDVFQFIWLVDAPPLGDDCHPIPQFEPAPVIIQTTGVRIPAGDVLTAHVELGNTSPVRKRVSLLLHQWDFADLSACSFWLEPNTPLQTYAMRMHTTIDWSDAAFSVYAATRGPETWIEMDNAVLMRTPSTPTVGTECWGPIPPPVSDLQPTVKGDLGQRAAGQGRASLRGAVPSTRSEIASEAAPMSFTGRVLSYLVPPDSRVLALEVSSDGDTWETIMFMEPSEDWRTVTIDWSQITTPVFYIRITA